MSDIDIHFVPFDDIADVLASTSHGRRMAGVLLALNPHTLGAGAVARKCWSREFIQHVGEPQGHGVVECFLQHNALSKEGVLSLASDHALASFDDEANKNEPFCSNVLTALGSPLMGARAVEMFGDGKTWTGNKGRDLINHALMGNPLVFADRTLPVPNSESDVLSSSLSVFIRNAALFGCLNDSRISDYFARTLSINDTIAEAAAAIVIRDNLLLRERLPDDLIKAIHHSTTRTIDDSYMLVQRDDHRALVRGGRVDGVFCHVFSKSDRVGAFYVFSPETPAERIAEEFHGAGKARSLLNARNCPEFIYSNAITDECNLLMESGFMEHSPFAKRYVERFPADVFWKKFRADVLDEELEDGEGLRQICLPNIPFHAISPKKIRKAFSEDTFHLQAAYIVGAMRSRQFAEALGPVTGNSESDLAAVFAPHTSGRQLEKFAGAYPGLAGLAACHPNGTDVDIALVPSEQRDTVLGLRETSCLAGRGLGGPASMSNSLVL